MLSSSNFGSHSTELYCINASTDIHTTPSGRQLLMCIILFYIYLLTYLITYLLNYLLTVGYTALHTWAVPAAQCSSFSQWSLRMFRTAVCMVLVTATCGITYSFSEKQFTQRSTESLHNLCKQHILQGVSNTVHSTHSSASTTTKLFY